MGRLLGVAPLWATHVEVKPGIHGVLKQGWLVKIKGGKNDAARDWIVNHFISEAHQRGVMKGWLLSSREDILADFAKDPSMSFMRLKPDEVKNMYSIDFAKVDRLLTRNNGTARSAAVLDLSTRKQSKPRPCGGAFSF